MHEEYYVPGNVAARLLGSRDTEPVLAYLRKAVLYEKNARSRPPGISDGTGLKFVRAFIDRNPNHRVVLSGKPNRYHLEFLLYVATSTSYRNEAARAEFKQHLQRLHRERGVDARVATDTSAAPPHERNAPSFAAPGVDLYAQLQAQHTQLRTEHTQLQAEHTQLQNNYRALIRTCQSTVDVETRSVVPFDTDVANAQAAAHVVSQAMLLQDALAEIAALCGELETMREQLHVIAERRTLSEETSAALRQLGASATDGERLLVHQFRGMVHSLGIGPSDFFIYLIEVTLEEARGKQARCCAELARSRIAPERLTDARLMRHGMSQSPDRMNSHARENPGAVLAGLRAVAGYSEAHTRENSLHWAARRLCMEGVYHKDWRVVAVQDIPHLMAAFYGA